MHFLVIANGMPYAFADKREAMEFIGNRTDGFQLFRYEPETIPGDGGNYHPLNIEAVRFNLERRLNNAA